MSFKSKVGQGTEGKRIYTVPAAAATYILHVDHPGANGVAEDASGPIVVDECELVSLQLFAGGTLAGSWKVEASNDYSGAGQYTEPPNAGRWKDITAYADIVPALTAVIDGNAATETQLVRFWPCGVRALRISFTETAGTGDAECWLIGKGA